MLEIFIAGGYLALLLYAILVENVVDFREYMTQLMEVVIKTFKIKNMHPFTLIVNLGLLLLFTSWIGFVILLYLIIDFAILQYKNRKK